MTHTATLLRRLTGGATVIAVMILAAVTPLSAQTAPKHKSRAKTANHRSANRLRRLIAPPQRQMTHGPLKRNTIDRNVIKPGKITDKGVIKPRTSIDKGMVIRDGGKG